jgi:hypothetical protein
MIALVPPREAKPLDGTAGKSMKPGAPSFRR